MACSASQGGSQSVTHPSSIRNTSPYVNRELFFTSSVHLPYDCKR
ncbi:hypothetical protein BDFB_012059, partial [Asbolus verrucosus]